MPITSCKYLLSPTKGYDNDISKIIPFPFEAYLAKTPTSDQFNSNTYIPKSPKNQKGKPRKNGFAPMKNDITKILDLWNLLFKLILL